MRFTQEKKKSFVGGALARNRNRKIRDMASCSSVDQRAGIYIDRYIAVGAAVLLKRGVARRQGRDETRDERSNGRECLEGLFEVFRNA